MKQIDNYEYILHTFEKVKNHIPTLTANQYNYYRDPLYPVANTITKRTQKSWVEILDYLGLHLPLSRSILARLSRSLHLLEKKIRDIMGLGWEEKSFYIGKKLYRPDSFCSERVFIQDKRLFVLDVKLCASAAPQTIYKYLPIFEAPPQMSTNQLTFFSHWLPQTAFNEEPLLQYNNEGQMSVALQNNVLYICYLIGVPQSNIIPSSSISNSKTRSTKKIPNNMEVRYVHFHQMPYLYCEMAGIPLNNEVIPVIKCAEIIHDVILSLPEEAESISQDIHQLIRDDCFQEVEDLFSF